MISYNITNEHGTRVGVPHSAEVCIHGDGTSGTTLTYYKWGKSMSLAPTQQSLYWIVQKPINVK